MEYKDYYKILGVSREASQDEIKRAYRKQARKHHPDVNKGSEAEARFKEINEANEVLKDPEKRAAYDRLGQNWQQGQDFRPPPDWGETFSFQGRQFGGADQAAFSDFFESLFGGSHFQARGQAQHRFRTRGEDQHATLAIRLEDAYQGSTQTVQLHQVRERDQDGRIVNAVRTLKVKIPAGVIQGQQIRLSGQGLPGIGGGPAGDLFLEIDFLEHPLFGQEGLDIFLTLPIAPWEAALGATIKVPTLGGMVDVKIPPGSQSGRKLRLKGRGLGDKTRGDQYMILQIIVPEAKTEAARSLYLKMAEELAFNPRGSLGG